MGLNALGLGFLFEAKDLATGVMEKVEEKLKDLEGHGKEAAEALGQGLKQFGAGLALMGVGLAGLEKLDHSTEIAEEFAHSMKLAGNKVGEAELPMSSMSAIADELGNKFGVLPVEEMNAMSAAIGAGARTAATAEALLSASNRLSLATGDELQGSLRAISGVVRAFNLDMTESAHVADAMFAASRHVEDGIQGMTSMLTILAPVASQAHISSDELIASIAQMSAAGIEGRHGMMGLHQMIESLIEPTDKARAEAARLGIAFDKATRTSEGLAGVLADITSSGRMNDQTLEKMFGSAQAATVAMGLMRDGGGQLKKMMNEVTHSTDAAAEAAEKMVSEEKRFKSMGVTLDRMIGDGVLPMKEAFYKLGIGILESLTKTNPAVVHFFAQLWAGVSVLAVVLGAGLAIAAAWPLIAWAFGALIAPAVAACTAIAAALAPVVLIAAAVVLAIWGMKIAFDRNFGGIADAVHAAWEDIKLVFTSLVELFTTGGFTEDTWQKLEKHSGIREFAITVYMWVSRIGNFFKGMAKAFEEVVEEFSPFFHVIGEALEQLCDAFSLLGHGTDGAAVAFDEFGVAGEFLGDVLGGVFGAIMVVIDGVIATISAAVAIVVGFVDVIRALFSGLLDFFAGFFEIFAIFTGDWATAWHGMKMMVFGVVDSIIGVVTAMVGALLGIIDGLFGAFGQKLHLQASMQNVSAEAHNGLATWMGVGEATGLRSIRPDDPTDVKPSRDTSTSTVVGGSSAGGEMGTPFARRAGPGDDMSMPGLATGSGGGGEASISHQMADHLEQIAKNTAPSTVPPAPTTVVLQLDGKTIAKAVAKGSQSLFNEAFDMPATGG